ncbi:MAG: type I DNA topoisomerase [Bacilli bacterium]
MKLIIVESPTKSHTISRYLGNDYKILASVGHIRDLATTGPGQLGIDINRDFAPRYIINKDKYKVVNSLKDAVKKADEIFIATDPDREGEAIAWHLAEVLSLPLETTKRLEFHEITRDGVAEGMKKPRSIDLSLVSSQETRRILDRIIGFKLSKLLQWKIKSPSAGRVQSSTLKIIVDREKEIRDFIPEEYWTLEALIAHEDQAYRLQFIGLDNGEKKIVSKTQMEEVLKKIPGEIVIEKIEKKQNKKLPPLPFTTSTLQQEAFNKLHMRVQKTTRIAAKLFEGITIDEGPVGLITYIRTDSTRLSPSYLERAHRFIAATWGEEYYLGVPKKKGPKTEENIQDAHEAIRPTGNQRTPESLKDKLSKDEFALYRLIYARTLASLMPAKIEEKTIVTFKAGAARFNIEASATVSPGYAVIYGIFEGKDDPKLPTWQVGDRFKIKELVPSQNFTKAPPRYSEARIIKMMEDLGIGRPSTYASTLSTLQQRGYLTSTKGVLTPTEQGELTTETLQEYFPEFISAEFTAKMEKELDDIATEKTSRSEILHQFYHPFIEQVDYATKNLEKIPPKPTGEICPKCGSELVVRKGRYGEFIACSNYPRCRYVKKEKAELKYTGENCPECGRPLVERKSKKGKPFVGCSGFPSCRYIQPKIKEE